MMDIKNKASTCRVITSTISINAEDIQSFLMRAGISIPSDAKVSVKFSVPGGGDWSNTDIEISDENPITITIVKTDDTE